MATVQTTKPIAGQQPGTSGLRKKTEVFMEPHYLHNFVQSVFNALNELKLLDVAQSGGKTVLLVGGDGRYWTREAITIICQIAAGNGVSTVWIAKDGLVSTPAASAIIREREGGICQGGFLLTASHNPGGIKEDFGVKYNMSNGGPATETVTDLVYKHTETMVEYLIYEDIKDIDISKVGRTSWLGGKFETEVIDTIEIWANMMEEIFDFPAIKQLFKRPDFKMLYDGMYGVAGPYAKDIFLRKLGGKESWLMGCEPKEDFNGGHPDPNLVYAHDLVKALMVDNPSAADKDVPEFGAAGDGDCDRNMILGKGFFVTPGDSLAIIVAHAQDAIPYFWKHGISGVSRSMPTSEALDHVAKKLGVPLYEVPTGWKYFGNLMDANKISICGEESFGTGSNHIREKDGLWAVLCWLSILAHKNKDASKHFVGVSDVVNDFWNTYGRNYYSRYDYENVRATEARNVMNYLTTLMPKSSNMAQARPDLADLLKEGDIKNIDVFEYTDPVDHSISPNQGIRVQLMDGSRVVYRLSGTGSEGATIRIYIEKYIADKDKLHLEREEALRTLGQLALQLCQIEKFTNRHEPTVIT